VTPDLAVTILGWAFVIDGLAVIAFATYWWCRRVWLAEQEDQDRARRRATREETDATP
jgi:hypothetical protein